MVDDLISIKEPLPQRMYSSTMKEQNDWKILVSVDETKHRIYDPWGRLGWWQIDPKADLDINVSWSPYNYAYANPIRYTKGETGIMIPGMSGIVDGYFELAEHIPEPTVYGIQMVGFDGKADPLLSLPSMARHYAEMIQKVKPEGKITLYAHSFGGK